MYCYHVDTPYSCHSIKRNNGNLIFECNYLLRNYYLLLLIQLRYSVWNEIWPSISVKKPIEKSSCSTLKMCLSVNHMQFDIRTNQFTIEHQIYHRAVMHPTNPFKCPTRKKEFGVFICKKKIDTHTLKSSHHSTHCISCAVATQPLNKKIVLANAFYVCYHSS